MDALNDNMSDEIVSTVKLVISDVNNGMSPNTAFTKVVKSGKFSPEIVSRMVEAFNQSKAVKQLEEAPEARHLPFDLANPEEIFNEVYSSDDKDTSGMPTTETALDNVNFLDKAAHVNIITYQTSEEYNPSERTVSNAILKKQAAIDARVRVADMEEASGTREALTAIKAASASLRKQQHEPFVDVERRMQRAFGDKGRQLVEMVYKTASLKREVAPFEKQSSYIIPPKSPYIEITKAVGALEKVALARSKKGALEVFAAYNRSGLAKQAGLYALDRVVDEFKPGPDSGKKPMYTSDPEFDAEYKKIAIKTTLANLLRNDEVISSYPTEKVISVANDLATAAPHLAENPSVLRAALHRGLVDHNMSLDEALKLVESDNEVRINSDPNRGKINAVN